MGGGSFDGKDPQWTVNPENKSVKRRIFRFCKFIFFYIYKFWVNFTKIYILIKYQQLYTDLPKVFTS